MKLVTVQKPKLSIVRTITEQPTELRLLRHGAPPRKPPSESVRARKYLTPEEIIALIEAAGSRGYNKDRDKAVVLIGYRHAMRNEEISELHWTQIDLVNKTILINRCKGSQSTVHPLSADEVTALQALKYRSGYVFQSQRGENLGKRGIFKIIANAGRIANIPLPVCSHMLRHSKLTQLAKKRTNAFLIQAYAGHKDIRSTLVYVHQVGETFEGLSDD